MDLSKYYIEFEEGRSYIEELQEMVQYAVSLDTENQFESFKMQYHEFVDKTFAQLKRLHKDLQIDIKSKEFQENEELQNVVADMVMALSMAGSEELVSLLLQMNFSFESLCHLVDVNAFCKKSQIAIEKNNLGHTTGNVFFGNCFILIWFQMWLAIEKEFGNYREEYNGSKNVLESKISFLNLLKRIKRAEQKGEEIQSDNQLTKMLTGPLSDFFEQVARGLFLKNDEGTYNLSGFSIFLLQTIKDHSPQRPTDHILFELYDIFEVIYPCKGLNAESESHNKAILKSSDNKYLYVKDYKRDMVRSILGIT